MADQSPNASYEPEPADAGGPDLSSGSDNAAYRDTIVGAAQAVHDALQVAAGAVHGARGLANATFHWEWEHPIADFENWLTSYGSPSGEASKSGPSEKVQQLTALFDTAHDWLMEANQSFTDSSIQSWLNEGNQIIARAKDLAGSISANLAAAGPFAKWLTYLAGESVSPDDPSAKDPANKPPGLQGNISDTVLDAILLLAAVGGMGWVLATFGPDVAEWVRTKLGLRKSNPRQNHGRRRLRA